MHRPAIIIPAFQREKSLSRLLGTVNDAYYPDDRINMIISIDRGATEEVKKTAKNFDFKHGQVQVIEHSKKLGLKDHIIKCADFALEYGSVIVLEEDLVVSPSFYTFALHALNYYKNDPSIAGVSLYSQRFNETAQLPFEPLKTEYSVYFMKLVCSWGQAWTKVQWQEFKQWYQKEEPSNIEQNNDLPDNVKEWSKHSWKKYFNTYLSENDKFIAYPYSSFSTHTGDQQGKHIKKCGNLFQVPLTIRDPKNNSFIFPEFDKHLIKYDMHMEVAVEFINQFLNLDSNKVSVDLYGTKTEKLLWNSDYILSSKKFKKPIKSFPLQFKPLELNIKFDSFSGEPPFFYLYRTKDVVRMNYKKPNHLRFARYFSYQNFSTRNIFKSFLKNLVSSD